MQKSRMQATQGGLNFLMEKINTILKLFLFAQRVNPFKLFGANCKIWKTQCFNEVTVQCPGQVFCAARLTQPTAPAGSLSPRQPRPPRGVLQVNMAGSQIDQRRLSRCLLQVNTAGSMFDQRSLSRRSLQVKMVESD